MVVASLVAEEAEVEVPSNSLTNSILSPDRDTQSTLGVF